MVQSLRSVTYISRATQPMSEVALSQLGLEAARLNALDGITGLLVFNGERFCQTIEGSAEAIANLVARLRRDRRHTDFEIVADEQAKDRRFRSWDMQVLSVPEDREAALDLARSRLDSELDVAARAKLYATVEGAFA